MTEISDLVDQVIKQEAAKFSVVGAVGASFAAVSRRLIWVRVLASLVGAGLLMRLGRARERDRLEEEVTRRTGETVALALHIECARERARRRAGPSCTGIERRAGWADDRCEARCGAHSKAAA